MSNATMEDRRRQREDDSANTGRRVHARSSTPHLPGFVIGLGYRNRKHRFFVPSTNNSFCGIDYSFVMMDSGCNSFLLPFPQKEAAGAGEVGNGIVLDTEPELEIDMDALNPFLGDEFKWTISSSAGTGAIGSKVLRIQHRLDDDYRLGEMRLAFARPVQLKYLRFHLGSTAVNALKDHPKLIPAHQQALQELLTRLGGRTSKERKHALVGQYYLDQVCTIQHGTVMFMVDKDNRDPINISEVAAQCDLFATPLVDSFEGFNDLEDEDHDGDDDEDRRLSWEPADYIDETDDDLAATGTLV